MVAPSSTVSAVRAPRRRRRLGALLVLVVLAVLIGRGLGLAGREDAATPGGTTGTGSQEPAPAPSSPLAAPQTPSTPEAEPLPTAAAPLGEVAVVEPPPPSHAVPAAETGFDADRFASMTSLVTASTTEGRLGAALGALQNMRRLPLDALQRASLVTVAGCLEDALAAACSRVVQSVCQGQVLAARSEVLRLVQDGEALTAPWLDSALRSAGLPAGLLAGAAANDGTLPIPRPLARGRTVRFAQLARTGTGTVIDSRSDAVTLRLQTSIGQSFPTLPRSACEPVQATGEEAIEMGFAAMQVHDVVLARLWLAVARLHGAPSLGERGDRLAALLP